MKTEWLARRDAVIRSPRAVDMAHAPATTRSAFSNGGCKGASPGPSASDGKALDYAQLSDRLEALRTKHHNGVSEGSRPSGEMTPS